MNVLTTKTNHWTREFDSVTELIEFAENGPLGYAGNHDLANGWEAGANGHTFNTLKAAIANPPTSLTGPVKEMAEQLVDSIRPPTRTRRKLRRNLEDGAELDPEAWLYRRPDGWSDTERVRTEKRIVRVLSHSGVLSHRSPSELMWRGAAVVAMADILTEMGFSVEVVGAARAREVDGRYGTVMTSAVVKRAESPIDLGALCLCLCEVGFHRLATLAVRARILTVPCAAAYGGTCNFTPEDRVGFDAVMDSDVYTKEAAYAAVLKIVAGFTPKES